MICNNFKLKIFLFILFIYFYDDDNEKMKDDRVITYWPLLQEIFLYTKTGYNMHTKLKFKINNYWYYKMNQDNINI